MNCKNSAVAYLFNSNVLSTGWFLGPRGPIVLPSVGPVLSSVQEFLLLFIPSYPSPPTSVPTTVTLVTPPVTPVVVVVAFVVIVDFVLLLFLFLFLLLSGGTGLLQKIIWMDRPLANDHQEKTGLLQMIIKKDRPFANDHQERPASCK